MRRYVWYEATKYTSDRTIGLPYLSNLPQFPQEHSPGHLNTHRLPVIFSLPDVRESKKSVVRGFVGHFQAGEDLRSTEEGVGQESGPWVRIDTRVPRSGHSLTTRGVRHREGNWWRRDTLRKISANAAASSEDKPVREVLPLDIKAEIDG